MILSIFWSKNEENIKKTSNYEMHLDKIHGKKMNENYKFKRSNFK